MAEWDTTALVEDVKERGSLPANDARFTTAKILSAATLEMRGGVAPMLSASRAEYLVYPYTVAITSGTASYRMPSRAVGGTLRNVSWLDSANNPKRLRELSQDEVETTEATTQGTPFGYYVRNASVVLVPTPNVVGTLSMPYYARPSKLAEVDGAQGGTIDSVTLVNGNVDVRFVVECGSISNGAAFTASATDSPLDFISSSPLFETLVSDLTPDSVTDLSTGKVRIQYAVADFDTLPAAGDYLYLAGYAPVPQLPVELHGLLAARTARRLVKAVGDDRFAMLSEDVAELEQKARDWLTQRVAGQTQQAGGSVGSGGLGPFGGAWWQW